MIIQFIFHQHYTSFDYNNASGISSTSDWGLFYVSGSKLDMHYNTVADNFSPYKIIYLRYYSGLNYGLVFVNNTIKNSEALYFVDNGKGETILEDSYFYSNFASSGYTFYIRFITFKIINSYIDECKIDEDTGVEIVNQDYQTSFDQIDIPTYAHFHTIYCSAHYQTPEETPYYTPIITPEITSFKSEIEEITQSNENHSESTNEEMIPVDETKSESINEEITQGDESNSKSNIDVSISDNEKYSQSTNEIIVPEDDSKPDSNEEQTTEKVQIPSSNQENAEEKSVTNNDENKKNSLVTIIVPVVISCLALIAIIIVSVYLIVKRRRDSETTQEEEESSVIINDTEINNSIHTINNTLFISTVKDDSDVFSSDFHETEHEFTNFYLL